jgi:N-acetylmuramoyl-L-alanine amidase
LSAIVIDPGHGGTDPGTVAHEQFEKTWTLSVGLALAGELRQRGWRVELTRGGDTTLSLPERCAVAGRERRLAYVSIHFNAGGSDASGAETYFSGKKAALPATGTAAPVSSTASVPADRRLAEMIQAAVCEATGSRDRGVREESGYYVLNNTGCPAVLVECGFLTNAAECQNIQNDAWRAKLVRGLADGLQEWLMRSEPAPPAALAGGD